MYKCVNLMTIQWTSYVVVFPQNTEKYGTWYGKIVAHWIELSCNPKDVC